LNCIATAPFEVEAKAPLTVNFNATSVECTPTGVVPTVDVTVTGAFDSTLGSQNGRSIATYIAYDSSDPLNPVEFSRNATGSFTVPVGEWQFQVIDDSIDACASDLSGILPVVPIPNVEITLDRRFAFVNCNDGDNGVINASVTGGTGAYTYTLSTDDGFLLDNITPFTPIVQSDSEFRNLSPANYIYTVTTDRNCSDAEPFDITNPPPFEPTFTATDVTCEGFDNGMITIEATGGTPPYSYAIDNGEFLNDISDGEIGMHVFDELLGGTTYTVLAQDALGCSEIMMFTIDEPDALMVAVNGEPTPETCFGDADGTVTVIITGGTAPYRTNITNNDADFVEGMFDYADLPAGITTVFVIDANDCRTELPVTIEPGVILNAALESRTECPVIDTAGNVTTPPTYFVDFVLGADSETTGIIYTLNGINGTANPAGNMNATGEFEVSPGQYEGVMLHEDGCEENIGTVTIDVYEPLAVPMFEWTGNPADPNEYRIIQTGGARLDTDPFYTFEVGILEDGQQISDVVYSILVDGNEFRIRETATYVVRVTDANGCMIIYTEELTYINIRIPNFFRPNPGPNGGGGNPPGGGGGIPEEERLWYPRPILPPGTTLEDNPNFFDNMEVKIFDRYGRMLAEFKGNQDGWDGIYQGKELPSGDYWFTVILNDLDNREFTGHFTLYR